MNIPGIYKKYNIMPQLAEHQLKVAGVAVFILDHSSLIIERQEIITACLLHDMGNIIKFDLAQAGRLYPGRFSQEELAYWQEARAGQIKKYGPDEHRASMEIAREIGVSARVLELIDCIGFQNGKVNAQSDDFGKKICAYSDMRVGLNGIISLEERFLDLRVRYGRKHMLMGGNENLRLEFEAGLREIEKQIFIKCKIKPEEITESEVLKVIDALNSWEI